MTLRDRDRAPDGSRHGHIAELLERLAALLPEPVAEPTSDTTSHHKVSGSPAPWHAEAGSLFMDIHEGARRLEASLSREVAGHLGERRVGFDGNTAAALASTGRPVHCAPE